MAGESALQGRLREVATGLGARYVGVGDLRPVREVVVAQGGAWAGEFRFGVSVGIPLSDAVVDQLWQHVDRNLARTYHHHIYGVVNLMLDRVATTLAQDLERAGHRAFPVPASQPYDDERLAGLVSHKLVGHLAGHGWIGKNCLLVTKEHGPRVRWGTVLTDAPLAPTGAGPTSGDECRDCRLCVELCPAQAFTGIPFDPAEDVEARFHRSECRAYLDRRRKAYGAGVCGLCVHVCPHGWSAKRERDGARTTPDELRRRLAGARAAFEASA